MSPSTTSDNLDMTSDILTSNRSAIEIPNVSEQSSQPSLLSEPSAGGTVCTRSGRTSRHPQHYRLPIFGYTVLWL